MAKWSWLGINTNAQSTDTGGGADGRAPPPFTSITAHGELLSIPDQDYSVKYSATLVYSVRKNMAKMCNFIQIFIKIKDYI